MTEGVVWAVALPLLITGWASVFCTWWAVRRAWDTAPWWGPLLVVPALPLTVMVYAGTLGVVQAVRAL